MKLFGRTGGYWLFYISAAYLVVGMVSLYNGVTSVWLSPLYILFLAMPFWFPPLGRSMNLDVTWDKDMFNLFGKKNKQDNVVKFPGREPGASSAPPAPPRPPEEEKKEEPAKIYYRLGLTDNNRVAFSMGYTEITMNATGCQQMIDQLKFFQSQLTDEDGSPTDDPDGGLPLPEEVENKKAA